MRDFDIEIQSMISNKSEREDILTFVKGGCRDTNLKPSTLGMLFEVYSNTFGIEGDDLSWFSETITIEELCNIHPGFQSTNGNQWARSDNSYPGKKYIIKRASAVNEIYRLN